MGFAQTLQRRDNRHIIGRKIPTPPRIHEESVEVWGHFQILYHTILVHIQNMLHLLNAMSYNYIGLQHIAFPYK